MLTAAGSPLEMEEVDIRGRKTRVWKHLPPTLRHVLAVARTHGSKIFIVHEDERVTYDAFHRAVAALAAQLRAEGVQKGDRVAVVMRNLPEWPVAFYATAAIGAIVTPLNAWWTAPELEYGLADSGAKIAIVDAERYARLAEHLSALPDLERVYVARELEPSPTRACAHLEPVIGEPSTWADLRTQPAGRRDRA